MNRLKQCFFLLFEICLCLAHFQFAFRKLKADKAFSWNNLVSQNAKRKLHLMIKMQYEFY